MNLLFVRVISVMLIAGLLQIGQQGIIRARIDLVVVPVSVRNGDGKLISDLTRDDFQILEDGRPQQIANLSSDPLPLSIVLLIDTGMGGSPLSRAAGSIVSLTESMTGDDEAEVYRFDHIVMKLSDFTGSHEELEKKLAVIKAIAANEPNRAKPFRIFPGRGPHWLRWLLGDSDPEFEHKNINDPVFASALDLEKRAMERRKIILLVSDGQQTDDWSPFGKSSILHSLQDTNNRLLQSQIQLFGITLGGALLEGKTSLLHAYADATGGDVYSARTQNAMDTAMSRIMVQARHQYVLSYVSNNEVRGLLPVTRKIEVKVNRPGLKVNHRKSYLQYPAPQD